MLGEFVLGRGGKSDAVGDFRRLSPGSKWWIVGAGGILASYLITIFYMVVAGWTLEYIWQSVTGALYDVAPDVGAESRHYAGAMKELLYGTWRPLLATALVVGLNILILMKGGSEGD